MKTNSKPADMAKIEPLDISSEAYRVYTYPNGAKLRIEAPESLFVLHGDSHRIIDADGLTHRPTPGFLSIAWMPRPGAPAYKLTAEQTGKLVRECTFFETGFLVGINAERSGMLNKADPAPETKGLTTAF